MADIPLQQSSSDAGVSVSSSNVTQTRFSFYNAEDFIPKSSPKEQRPVTRFNFYNGDAAPASASASEREGHEGREEEELKGKIPQHQKEDQQKYGSAGNNMDSVQILRSLQEHEQQRLEILGGTSSIASSQQQTPRKNNGGGSTGGSVGSSAASSAAKAAVASTSKPILPPVNGAVLAEGSNDETNNASSNNPYEDAIKEALDLLRKHRSALSVNASATPAKSSVETSTQPEQPLPRSAQQQQHQPTSSSKLFVDTSIGGQVRDVVQTPAEADRVLRTRAAKMTPEAAVAAANLDLGLMDVLNGVASNVNNPLPSPPGSDVHSATSSSIMLGEAYQAEIEARRKQRQERMAKYASRLAELKQDQQDTPMAGSSWSAGGVSATAPLQQGGAETNADTSAATSNSLITQPEEPPLGAYDEDQPFHAVDNEAACASQAGSLSTITAGCPTKDDEVQRGVEKVLLAILERANSNCRSPTTEGSVSSSGNNGTGNRDNNHEMSSVQSKPSWQQGEEKKSNSESDEVMISEEENSLLQAMSDLLRSGGHHEPRTIAPQHQQVSLLLDEEREQQLHEYPRMSTSSRSYHDDDYDPIAASRSLDDDVHHHHRCEDEEQAVHHSAATPNASLVSFDRKKSSRDMVDSNTTELANESAGVKDIAPDEIQSNAHGTMSPHDELDELARQFSGPMVGTQDEEVGDVDRTTKPLPSPRVMLSLKSSSTNKDDDSIDERVRRILVENNNNSGRRGHDSASSLGERYTDATPTDNDDADEGSAEGTSVDRSLSSDEDDTGSGTVSSYGESVTDNTDDEDDSVDPHNDTIDGVLGPLNRRAGGRTGVVLEPDSPKNDQGPSILESLSAAMSLVVTGNASASSGGLRDKYSTEDLGSDNDGNEDDSDVDSEANELMRSLCAHLLPMGVNKPNSRLLGKLPEWDEANPDEPGYRIVRLTSQQLRRVEHEFDNMVDNLKRNSQRDLRRGGGSDETFERDLEAAEELLDREEERLKAAETAVTRAESSDELVRGDSKVGETSETAACNDKNHTEHEDEGADTTEELANFPGVKRAGQGEMGDLEYFHLPIIFKSHVTGFEPTKDLCLEAGNVVAGQYLVEGELGSAAFSTAYRCIDLNSEGNGPDGHEEVCLKVIKNTKDFFDQSLDEIKILELLRQTGMCQEKAIVEMKTFFYHREHLIIVTELLRQNLFEFGKFIVDHDEEPYFTIPRLGYITRQVLVALDFVHNLGLVHSDVKPENILLGSYSRAQVKLIDFGSSCYLTDRQSSYIQSRSYRAPEVVLGLPYDGRIDVWSLGCVIAEMFTGEVTFQNDSIVSMLSRIEAICGPFPRHMIAQGRQSGRFFTKCGLTFEKVLRQEDAEEAESVTSAEALVQHFDIFQPKITSLSARLGFEMDLLESFDGGKKLSKEQYRRAIFVDFVRKLLTIDPEARPSAKEALEHPWMQYAASLTEEDIKYPSS